MAQLVNKKRSEMSFSIKDYVYIKLQQYKQQTLVRRLAQKLLAKFFGTYLLINKIENMAYKLELPPFFAIYPIFHVSQLKRHIGSQLVQSTLPNLPQASNLQPQAILDKKITKKKKSSCYSSVNSLEGTLTCR
jgi:hypothetical protein